MGACSSKPKTTEFEGSTEPSKKTEDVGADRSIDVAQVSQQNEPGKECEGAADAGSEVVQETRELVVSKDEEPLIKGLLSTAEEVSYSVKVEAGAVNGEAGDSTAEKGKEDDGDAQKVDTGDGVAVNKGVSDKATTVGDVVGGDQDKLFEDKAIVLDEASNRVVGMGDAYIDKAVAADDGEKAHESSDKGSSSVMMQDDDARDLQDIDEAPGAESPIIGVVQFAEPIHVDESVGLAAPETTADDDSKVCDSPYEIERDVSTGTNIGEDCIPPTEEAVANLSSGSPQESLEEKDEVLHDVSKGSPLLVSVSDDGGGQESGADDARGKEAPLASADAQDEMSVEDTIKPETIKDLQNEIENSTSEPQEESSLEESARESHEEVTENEGNATKPETIEDPLNGIEKSTSEPQEESSLEESTRESHAEVTENEGNAMVRDELEPSELQEESSLEESARESHAEVTENEGNAMVHDEPEPEAPEVHKGIDAETSIEPEVETPSEQAVEGRGDGIVDEPNASDVEPQALALQETAEDGKPEATPDEVIGEPSAETDREEKVEKPHIEEATTNDLKVESVDAGNLESSVELLKKVSGEGDLVFEDASDVPLKVESSTIVSVDTPNP